DSTYDEEGHIEHYECQRCGRLFADNKAKDELTQDDVVIPRKVKKKILGDADGDGKFTVRDIALVKQYLANWKVTIDLDNSDINGDGKVTVKDLVYMKQKLAGWNTEYFDR
ncbi:MAG: dockerin type I repeat-containing protein, partial [Ruminococcus sp.]|nr:dockerin type I repeat-containing protein [Ruminococcus sp.]